MREKSERGVKVRKKRGERTEERGEYRGVEEV